MILAKRSNPGELNLNMTTCLHVSRMHRNSLQCTVAKGGGGRDPKSVILIKDGHSPLKQYVNTKRKLF